MKETIFSLLKILMVASFVGLIVYVIYVFNSPDKKENLPGGHDKNNDDKIHKMRKAG